MNLDVLIQVETQEGIKRVVGEIGVRGLIDDVDEAGILRRPRRQVVHEVPYGAVPCRERDIIRTACLASDAGSAKVILGRESLRAQFVDDLLGQVMAGQNLFLRMDLLHEARPAAARAGSRDGCGGIHDERLTPELHQNLCFRCVDGWKIQGHGHGTDDDEEGHEDDTPLVAEEGIQHFPHATLAG